MVKEEMKKYVFELAKLLDDKKAEDIVILDFEDRNDVTDFMIICHADSMIQIKALAEYVEKKMSKAGIKPMNRKTQQDNNPWILLDFVFVIVHIFHKQARNFYNIEKLWSDSRLIAYKPDLEPSSI